MQRKNIQKISLAESQWLRKERKGKERKGKKKKRKEEKRKKKRNHDGNVRKPKGLEASLVEGYSHK